ncbi:hypothetical protein SAMN03159382_03602 [Pseudomonas sp. NFACC23-1]|nr:hypothetical protein SAMN03159386_03472 [Pseudomonas sp. NFACC17-2]SEJ65124.1 hypothetical protein SAMN03159382_03602 [Pseudomonas sp. NFACC23-1]SFW81841.1 hypothetical protein SAMN05660640_03950 [Pseudomonas sp. NFACC16-2]
MGSRFFMPANSLPITLIPVGASKLAPTFLTSVAWMKAAEKRQLAEASCRFSGIAALPMPAKPRFMGLWKVARRLL